MGRLISVVTDTPVLNRERWPHTHSLPPSNKTYFYLYQGAALLPRPHTGILSLRPRPLSNSVLAVAVKWH